MWLEQKYVGLLSGRLRNFKQKNGRLWNFSCPLCGDSETREHAARGYVYEKRGRLMFHCHNCGVTRTFENLLREVDPVLHDELKLEKFADDGSRPRFQALQAQEAVTHTSFEGRSPLQVLVPVSRLPEEDPCRTLVLRRRIPVEYHEKLYSCPNFAEFTNSLLRGKLPEGRAPEARLLIPFIDDAGALFGYQGRALGPTRVKYITIMLKDRPRVFGLDAVDFTRRTYVFEGPIDSMFIENSLAVAGGDLTSIGNEGERVLVYDNEPRSMETVRKMAKAIDAGFTVCVWPRYVQEKDVNDMVLSGRSAERVRFLIDEGARRGLAAQAALSEWRMVRD